MKDIDVILIGRIAIDFNPTDIYRGLDESCNFKKYLGGSPANIAVGLARMGKKVAFLGKVSNDQFGDFVINYFKKEGINCEGIVRGKNGENIGLTFTEIKSEIESSILMYRNGVADLNFNVDEVNEKLIARSKMLIISGTALAQSPSREATLKAIEIAKRNDVEIIFDIDYRNYTWDNFDTVSIYYSIVARESTIIIGSREEFNLMEKVYLNNNEDNIKSANYLFDYKAKLVIIKNGSKGSTLYKKEGEEYNVSIFPIKLLKSFGGGDAYASAFISSYYDGESISDSLLYASAHAAMLVSSHSCSEDMKSIYQIREFIKKSKIKSEDIVRKNQFK